jgi:hypothetical protein
MNLRLLLLSLLWLGMACLRADPPSDPTPPETNPQVILDHYRQVLTRPEFIETQEPDANSRMKEWLSLWFLRLGAQLGQFKYASRMPAFESMLMTVLAALSITAVLYTMVRLTRRRGALDQQPISASTGPKTFRPPESYDQEIEQALRARDWHAAWLAGWRQFLSRLELRQLVEADRTRTNREYLAQLRARTIPGPALALLNRMVDAYDRFIYARHPISEPDWTLFHEQIGEATLLLHLEDRRTAPQKPSGDA